MSMFDQACFFGDYCGVLCNAHLYTDAKEKGNIAIKYIEDGNFTTLKYIYYNIGNIYLFQKEYAKACKWYELALEGATNFYTSVNSYLVNYGITQYYLGLVDKAKASFQLAITQSKGTKYNRGFEPFFYMMKIYKLQGEEKVCAKYKKMYLTRLMKYSNAELKVAIDTMTDKEEIFNDYATH